MEKAKNLVQLDQHKERDDSIPPNIVKGVDCACAVLPRIRSPPVKLTRSSFLAASDLRKKVAVITKDERGYGLTVHSESPVIVQSVKDGGWLHSSTT